jgi:nuclear transport factor 2 (NTF2) superfamily protein
METTNKIPTPPWDMDIAAERLTFEEAAWNTHDPEKIAAGYTAGIEMRDGLNFISGKEELKHFLTEKFKDQLDYQLKLDLWGALKGRMAVRFEAEWRDASGQWYHGFGVQVYQFDDAGLAEKRFASMETNPINDSDRRLN